MKLIYALKVLLMWTWCLPQTLIGLVIYLIYRKKNSGIEMKHGIHTTFWNRNDGVSLGWFIFIYRDMENNGLTHELGHTIQSLLLGPLYLVVIGLPSAVWANLICPKLIRNYYWFYTEKWAEHIANKRYRKQGEQ